MEKALDLISFYKDIEGIIKNKPVDARHLVLYIHLYVEHYILLICQNKGITGENLKERSKKLLDEGSIDKKAFDHILLIIDLRNNLVHSLTITIEEINERFDKMESLFNTDNSDLLLVMSSVDRWQKFHIFSVVLITTLYKIMCEVYKVKPKYDIRPEAFIHKDKKVIIKMILLKNNQEGTPKL